MKNVVERTPFGKITFYYKGNAEELDQLEASLTCGRRIRALVCEFPGNVLLSSVDLYRIHSLARRYDFIVVCDDTVSTAVNTDLFPFADILVTSLTKMFSGACNVTAGRYVLFRISSVYGAKFDR